VTDRGRVGALDAQRANGLQRARTMRADDEHRRIRIADGGLTPGSRERAGNRAARALAWRAHVEHDRGTPIDRRPRIWRRGLQRVPARRHRRREREDGARRVQRDQCKHVTDAGAYVLGAMQRLGHERRDRACRRQPQSAPRDRAHVSAVIARRHHAAPVVMPSRSLSWIGGRS